jgi:hypothetical protein
MHAQLVLIELLCLLLDNRRARNGDSLGLGLGANLLQPVAQAEGRNAIVLVVAAHFLDNVGGRSLATL